MELEDIIDLVYRMTMVGIATEDIQGIIDSLNEEERSQLFDVLGALRPAMAVMDADRCRHLDRILAQNDNQQGASA